MKPFFLASHNPGKQREFTALLAPYGWELVPTDAHQLPETPETGLTFVENALIKARAGSLHSQLPTLADDSGLIVPALNGEPGVRSARYAGDHATSINNMEKLLQRAVTLSDRTAFFYCVLVFLQHPEDPMPLIAQGSWEGQLANSPRGEGGFGYDPIFVTHTGQTAAELAPEEKLRLSHRGNALRDLVEQISEKRTLITLA